MLTVPILVASGHVAAADVKCCSPSSVASAHPVSEPAPPRPACPTPHASRPVAAPAAVCMPTGSSSVVERMSASALPSASRVVCCGTSTLTVRPVGVLAACLSGLTSIDGSKGSSPQPLSGSGDVYLAPSGATPAFHAVPSTSVVIGLLQEVGSIRNGGVWGAPSGLHGIAGLKPATQPPRPRQAQPRAWSWRGSAGTPHSVTLLPSTWTAWEAEWMLTLTP